MNMALVLAWLSFSELYNHIGYLDSKQEYISECHQQVRVEINLRERVKDFKKRGNKYMKKNRNIYILKRLP